MFSPKPGNTGRSHPLAACKICQNKVLDPKPQPLNPIFKINNNNYNNIKVLIWTTYYH